MGSCQQTVCSIPRSLPGRWRRRGWNCCGAPENRGSSDQSRAALGAYGRLLVRGMRTLGDAEQRESDAGILRECFGKSKSAKQVLVEIHRKLQMKQTSSL